MCGIVGWVDWTNDLRDKEELLTNMRDKLANRGPDEKGIWLAENVALAHRRLTVIDPVGGQQPMVRTLNGYSYVIVYNGELYNTEELRQELLELGYKFNSWSDTEVLLVSYIAWGENVVEHLNGIFAFAIWDEKNNQLFLARDRLGVKPLFYWQEKESLIFASELKALLAHPNIKPIIDRTGLAEIFGLGPSRTPGNGVFKGIKEVKPGYAITYELSGIKERRYWQLTSKIHLDDEESTINNVRTLVLNAIKRQLVSDVPLCTFLSGGLDSSAISQIAAEEYKEKGLGQLKTFSIDYEGNEQFFHANEFQPNSDNYYIKLMQQETDSIHHNITVNIDQLFAALKEGVIARDLPGMADIDSSLYLFSKEIKKEATVALSGECADEIFGGYPWFFREEDLHSGTFPWLRSLEIRENILAKEIREKIDVKEYVNQRYQETLAEVPYLPDDSEEERKMRKLFYLNINWFMATLLERKDRMSMATGLEVRVPYADHLLVEYVWNIPWELKALNGREKGLLRKALEGLLPEEVIYRKKSPYPKTHNPYYTKLAKRALTEVLNDPNSPILKIIDKKEVEKLISNAEETFTTPWFGQLMQGPQLLAYLWQVNYWLKEYQVEIEL